jgi:hypothetical protein
MSKVTEEKIANQEESGRGPQRSWFDAIVPHLAFLAGILLSKSGLVDRLFHGIGGWLGIGSREEQRSGPSSGAPSPAASDRPSVTAVQVPTLSGAPAPALDTPRRGH